MESKDPTNVDISVGVRVRERRKELELSQDTLAGKLGITFQQLQKYENGANRISAGRLYELAIALGTTIQYFFEDAATLKSVLRGAAEEGAGFDAGPDHDTIELVMAYQSIDDLAARKSILAIAKEQARASGRKSKKPRKR